MRAAGGAIGRCLGLALALAAGSCFQDRYECSSDAACQDGGSLALCLTAPDGSRACASADTTCPAPAQLRWDKSAPPAVAGACVGGDCHDNQTDGRETDVDCGGGFCPACPDDKACRSASDCSSHRCAAGQCARPTCTDGIKNGDETDVDCGGKCPNRCGFQHGCKADADCNGGTCKDGQCGACNPGQSGDPPMTIELGCGGNCGKSCTRGQKCNQGSDCTSGLCTTTGDKSRPSVCAGTLHLASPCFPLGDSSSQLIAGGDWNGDGLADLAAVVDVDTGGVITQMQIVVLLATDLSFATGGAKHRTLIDGPKVTLPGKLHPVRAVARDLDLDGRDDLVIADQGGDVVVLWGGAGSRGFEFDQVRDVYHVEGGVRDLAIGNLLPRSKPDSQPDIAVATNEGDSSDAWMLENMGVPTGVGMSVSRSRFAKRLDISMMTSSPLSRLTVGEFNDDGFDDLVLGFGTDLIAFQLSGTNDAPPVTYQYLPSKPEFTWSLLSALVSPPLAAVKKLVVAGRAGGVTVLSHVSGGDPISKDSSYLPREISWPDKRTDWVRGFASGDFNGDLLPDLAGLLSDTGSLQVQLRTDDPAIVYTFQTPTAVYYAGDNPAHQPGAAPVGAVAADFTGDGYDDLAVVSQSGAEVCLLEGHGAHLKNPNDASFVLGTDGAGHPASSVLPLAPVAVAVGDVNGDGTVCAAVVGVRAQDAELDVLCPNASGRLDVVASVALGAMVTPVALALGKLHPVSADKLLDKVLDVAIACTGPNTVLMVQNRGNRQFRLVGMQSLARAMPTGIAIGVVEGRDKPSHVAVSGSVVNDRWAVTVLEGDVNTGFTSFQSVSPADGSKPISLVMADIDKDHTDDVVLGTDATVVTYDGRDLNRELTAAHPIGPDASTLVAVDVDGDGRIDLVTGSASQPNLTVLLNKMGPSGKPTFSNSSQRPQTRPAGRIVAGDWNGDKSIDLALLGPAGALQLLAGRHDGNFEPPVRFAVPFNSSAIAAGDLNGDGLADLVVTARNPAGVANANLLSVILADSY